MALPNTHFGYVKINEIIGDGPKKIFFSGIGGISMNSLAAVCMARGHKVSGYDRTESDITDRLAAEGAEVYYESSADIVKDADALVYTVAIPEDDPAYVYAGEHGIPRISRADFLGYVMMSYASRVGICGMHGKSTTTGFAASVYTAAGLDPTVFGGAELKSTGTSNVLGGHRAFVFEACEYMDSFLDFYPTTAVVLNVEMDHVDYFHSMEQIRDSFGKFMAKAEVAVVNADDENVMLSTKKCDTKLVTFGMKDADFTPGEITYKRGFASFDIFHKGKLLCRAELKVPGRHMVYDVLAVAAAVAAFRAEKVNRIILTRPAVEAGERLGFLPGDLQSKVDPYLRPLYDALFDMLGADTYQKYLERGNIEVAPLAYMRGRTLDDSFIILDEAQNTSREQMKMFLTRIGFGSKVVITGDITQIDLPEDKTSGLKIAMKVLEDIDDIAICTLTGADVVRHQLVQKIIEAYEVFDKANPNQDKPAKPKTPRRKL